MGQSAGTTTPGKKSGSVYDQAAQGMQNAGSATMAAGQGYQNIANSPTGGLGQANTYNAAMQAGPGNISAGISGYMNPYENSVINNTAADINRQTQLGLRGIGDQAAGMGAFGGSRQGIAEGTAIGEGSRALGDISSQMRQAGWNTAAQLSGQDISNRMNVNAANQGAQNAAGQWNAGARNTFAQQGVQNQLGALAGMGGMGAQGAALAGQAMGIGQGLEDRQSQYGGQAQNINQSLIDQAASMFDQFTGQPLKSTTDILGLLSGNPLTGAKTTTGTSTPGTKSMLGDAIGLAARVKSGGAGGKGG